MFVKLGGKILTVAGKFATSLACCCGFDPKKWYCLLSSDGSYRCAQEYDFEQDQMLSEHGSKEDCEKFCGQDQVYCYYDDKIGYYCTNYFSEGYLSGPYPDTITCNDACKQMWFCVDKGSGGGETQYECVLQDPSEDYLSGPFGSKEACEYRCGDQFWCTYKYINTDEYEYECVKDNTGAPDNAISGPYGSDTECEVYCQPCEEIILPEQKDCPDCVDDACVYLAGEGGIDGGQWGTCCSGLIETWRYCDDEWTLILPCHPEGEKTAGTPACEVYPEKLDFPDDPVEGQTVSFECDRVLGFDPSDYPDCEDCDYSCVETDGVYDCELSPAGPHKTLQECIDKCPEKWGCISTDECVPKPDGTYLTETECIDKAPVDCAATGACCFPDGVIPAHCHDTPPYNTEGACVDAGGAFYVNGVCPDACPSPPDPICCVYSYGMDQSAVGDTPEEAIQRAIEAAIYQINTFHFGKASPTWGYQKPDGTWTQEAGYIPRFDRYFTNPIMIWHKDYGLYEKPECSSSAAQCTAPFAFPKYGDCSTDCPDFEPVEPLGCCYTYADDPEGNPDFTVGKGTYSYCKQVQENFDPSYEVVWNPLSDPDADCPETPRRNLSTFDAPP